MPGSYYRQRWPFATFFFLFGPPHATFPAMKRPLFVLALLLLLALALSQTGCASVDAEDRSFFYRGWLFPNGDKLPALD